MTTLSSRYPQNSNTASGTTVDASTFSTNLGVTDTDVQTALETLDVMVAGASGISGDTILFSTASVSWNNASIMGSSASEFSSDGAIRDVINLRQKALVKTTTTIATGNWDPAHKATKAVSGVTPSNLIFVAPAPDSVDDYADAGIRATAQGDDSITFVCTEKPTSEIDVNIVIGD